MIKIIALVMCVLFGNNAYAQVLSNEMGQNPIAQWMGNTGSVSSTNTDVNAAFVFGVSGTAYAVRFTSPVSQTSAALTVYPYIGAKTGTPTDTQLDVYPGPSGGDDPQRPGTSGVLGTVTGVDLSGLSAPAWATYSISSVTLVAGQTYWLVFTNNTATPGSNFVSYANRRLNDSIGLRLFGSVTTNGYTTDPTTQGSSITDQPIVIKFADGTLMGNPYVLSTNHANNSNDRGVRFKFTQSMKVAGLFLPGLGTAINSVDIYENGSATPIESVTLDISLQNNSNFSVVNFSTPLTFTANKTYDVMLNPSTNSTLLAKIDANAASSPPSDVTATTFANQWYVDGATPGSYTVTANATAGITLILDSFVPSAGGGSTGFFIQ